MSQSPPPTLSRAQKLIAPASSLIGLATKLVGVGWAFKELLLTSQPSTQGILVTIALLLGGEGLERVMLTFVDRLLDGEHDEHHQDS